MAESYGLAGSCRIFFRYLYKVYVWEWVCSAHACTYTSIQSCSSFVVSTLCHRLNMENNISSFHAKNADFAFSTGRFLCLTLHLIACESHEKKLENVLQIFAIFMILYKNTRNSTYLLYFFRLNFDLYFIFYRLF